MKRIILFLFPLMFLIFSNTTNSLANDIGNNISIDMKELNPDNIKKTDIPSSSSEDIFGDEQTFPFVAGLGKNAAH